MKKFSIISSLIIIILFTFTNSTYSSDKSKKGFDTLKSLVGTWQVKMPDGSITNVTYKLVSKGSTVMETISNKEEDGMITMYHLNGKSLMMTHYCSAGNQPRMKANFNEDKPEELNFKYVDATNLKSEKDMHMRNLSITFKDKNHISQAWTWSKDGKNTVYTFNLVRVK